MAFNVNPSPGSGSGVFGSVPGPISLPNPYQDVGKVYPALPQTQNAVSSDILKELQGNLSPDTLATIQNQGAAWGVSMGMPGSGVNQSYDLESVAQASQAQQAQGAKAYQQTVPNTSQYLTVNPNTEAEIAMTNSINQAKPNPTEAGLAGIGSQIAGLGWGYAMNNGAGGNGTTDSQGNSIETTDPIGLYPAGNTQADNMALDMGSFSGGDFAGGEF